MAAPFEKAFDDFAKMQEEASKFTSESAPEGLQEGGEVMAIHYRDEEAIYIKASHDRVTVIFSTIFREETDRIFGKVFLQVSIYIHISPLHMMVNLLKGVRRCTEKSYTERAPGSVPQRTTFRAPEHQRLSRRHPRRSRLRNIR